MIPKGINMRKVIQITISAGDNWTEVYALCNDGTIWSEATPSNEFIWTKLPPIPQDKEEE